MTSTIYQKLNYFKSPTNILFQHIVRGIANSFVMPGLDRRQTREHFARGFTLIEVMITVAIAGILAAVALPSYNQYVKKQKLRSVQVDLVGLALSVENQYSLSSSNLYPLQTLTTAETQSAVNMNWSPSQSADFEYTIEPNNSRTAYTLRATGITSTFSRCEISIDSANTKLIGTACGANQTWI